jgi:hypothetical protein
MTVADVRIRQISLKQQTMGTGGHARDHVLARVVFDLGINDVVTMDMYTEVTQPLGANYATDPLEVGPPMTQEGTYEGRWNQNAFHNLVETYYRRAGGMMGLGGTSAVVESTLKWTVTAQLELP